MKLRAAPAFVAAILAVVVSPTAGAVDPPPPISVGVISQQTGPDSAVIGADVTTHMTRPGHRGEEQQAGDTVAGSVVPGPTPTVPEPSYPVLTSDAALLQNPAPFGPGTFWYPDGSGHACVYSPSTSPLCFVVVGPSAQPALDPADIAAAVADRLGLSPGAIHASPVAGGVTGVASWFWLDPSPHERELSTSLAGETVTVTAVPSVSWQFGDGIGSAGGAGVPYQPGVAPPEAVVHVFQTRCLPGDQGRNPYVLSSCQSDGYRLRALVSWQISYRADGSITESGTLPTRTTGTSVAYPVSEVRGFLVGGGSP